MNEATGKTHEFAGTNGDYYARQFRRIQSATGTRPALSFNLAALLFGPLWASARGLWGYFSVFLFLEVYSLTQICRGLWGNLGAEQSARARRLMEKSEEMLGKAQAAAAEGSATAAGLGKNAENLQMAAEKAQAAAEAALAGGAWLTALGVLFFILSRAGQGLSANAFYERMFARWRVDPGVGSGLRVRSLLLGAAIFLSVFPLTVYRFVAPEPLAIVLEFPGSRDFFAVVSTWLDKWMDALATGGAGLFDGLAAGIRGILDVMEAVLVQTPWAVVFLVIAVLSWHLAGWRVAIFTSAGLAYLGLFGFWEKSMITVALLGTAALLCVAIGVPLGIWCGKSERAHNFARPVLDFMQTMPAFVYLIPVIAFFGTGKPPGIIATIVFGLPPVVRLTALGIRQVPESIKEGALAFGCTKRKLLLDVELPLALPSIMTGINQTILMCLSMVVIAALIGAKGLGEDVLTALQYAAKGQGLLAGFAILFCAMIIDRIVQGRFKSSKG